LSRLKRITIWIAILIPPFTFYLFLARSLAGLPVTDDYHSPLAFLLRWKSESGLQHLIQIVTFQHTDYRLMFENAVIGIQYSILGHTNLKALTLLGDLLVLPLCAVIYLIWREFGRPGEYTLLAFIPVSWILFQLQYASALDCVTVPLQIIPVILFALLTCFLAPRPGALAFAGTLMSLVACIASSGNGLFMVPIGVLIYLQRKQYKRLAVWCCLSGIACLIYFHGYDFTVEASHTHENNMVVSLFEHVSLGYGATFLGSIAAVTNPLSAIVFAIVLTALFLLATRDRLFVRNPALYYSCLFFFITGIAVSGIRSNFGLAAALGSRYRINSTALAALLYLYLADKLYIMRVRPTLFRAATCLLAVLLIGFNFASDRAGARLILSMQQKVEAAILRWQRHEPRPPANASASDDFAAKNEEKGFYEPDVPILTESIRQGIYQLPPLPLRQSQTRFPF
jgi:hypothetical protein